MRRLLLGLVILLGSLPLAAQSTAPVDGYCTLGGAHAAVSGLNATNFQQGIIPGCTVSIYLHGTQTLATIYADDNNTPLSNPFTAVVSGSPNSGYWIFWASTTQCYDVVGSGGTAPNSYPSPITIEEICLNGSGIPAHLYDIVFAAAGKPSNNVVLPIESLPFNTDGTTRTYTFPANFQGSTGHVQANPTSSAVWTVLLNGSNVGTVTVGTGGGYTFASSGGTPVVAVSGNWLEVNTPTPQDSTMSGPSFTFVSSF